MNEPIVNPTPEAPAVEITDLWHTYAKRQAVQGVSFTVARRSIHGFVGPNGAGKTTTLKVLATLVPAQRGRVRVFGHDLAGALRAVRRQIGYMPDHFSMYRQMTVFEYLDFFAAAYGLPPRARDRTIADVLALTDMDGRRDSLIRSLSRGMQQRVSLARALVHDPALLLLDEPASGLDPRARIELMEILQELRRLGKTIFISSHILSELATLCDHVTILDQGLVRYTGSMRGLVTATGTTDGANGEDPSGGAATAVYLLTLAAEQPAVEAALRALPGMAEVSRRSAREGESEDAGGAAASTVRLRVRFDPARLSVNDFVTAALGAGGQLVAVGEDVRHLNEAFMDLTSAGVGGE